MLLCVLLFWSGWLRGEKKTNASVSTRISRSLFGQRFGSWMNEQGNKECLAILLLSPWAPQNFWAKTSSCSCHSQILGSIIFKQKVKKPSLQFLYVVGFWTTSAEQFLSYYLPAKCPFLWFGALFGRFGKYEQISITWDNRFTIADHDPFDSDCEESQGHDRPNVAFFFLLCGGDDTHTFQIYDLRPATPTLWQQWLDFRKPRARSTSRKDVMASQNSKQICCTKLLGSTCCFHCLVIRQSG